MVENALSAGLAAKAKAPRRGLRAVSVAEGAPEVPDVSAVGVARKEDIAPNPTPETEKLAETFEAPKTIKTTEATETNETTTQLAIKLTGRHRRPGETKGVTITVPIRTLDRIDTVNTWIATDPRTGTRITPLNKSALLAEAATRYTNNPNQYPATPPTELTAQPHLNGHVETNIWEAMQTTWWGSENKANTYGPHLHAAINEILEELEKWGQNPK
jgi:hypothetical protein